MGNAPDIILFWFFGIAVLFLMIALLAAAIILMKKGRAQNSKAMRSWGKSCLVLGLLCSIPVVLVIGYILYLYLT